MHSTRETLTNLWRTHKALTIVLMLAALVALLAVVAPQAWATPDQRKLTQSITDFNDNPDPPECIRVCEGPMEIGYHGRPISDTANGGTLTGTIDAYVTENIQWEYEVTTVADPPGNVTVYHETTVEVVDGQFVPNPAVIWDPPEPGYYDVFFDVNRDKIFNNGDGVMGLPGRDPGDPADIGAGICVDSCAVGGATVPERWLGSVLPWIGIGALMFIAGAIIGLIWNRHRGRV